jgi:hypothetical protein
MASHYLSKSVKGKSIINNLDIDGELHVNTDMLNQSAGTYNIGSSSASFNKLFTDSINLSGNDIVESAPITLNKNGIGLNFNKSHFGVSNGSLILTANTTQSLITPIYQTQGSLALAKQAPFVNNASGELALNLQTTLDLNGFTIKRFL